MMDIFIIALPFAVIALPLVALVVWKRNDEGMLRRLEKSESRAMAKYLWFH